MRLLSTKPNTVAPDSTFPFGRIRDRAGAVRGTPVTEQVYGDIHQFFEKLMNIAAVVANGLPECAYSGFQLITALTTVITNIASALVATETSARIAADSAEATTRASADSTEATTRASADSSEATTRASADSTETAARIAADTTLQNNINSPDIFKGRQYLIANSIDTFSIGTIQHVTGAWTNAPTAVGGDHFIINTVADSTANGNKYQIAFQVLGTAIGTIYKRRFTAIPGTWDAWVIINNP